MRLLALIFVLALLGSVVAVGHRALRPETDLTDDLVLAEHLVEDVARRVVADPFQLVMPADLAPHHRDVPELAKCDACHGLTSDVQDAKCLGCHEEVAQRLDQRIGHHGANLRGSCERCHADHDSQLIELDRDAFRHDQALFALTGAHLAVDCAECHRSSALTSVANASVAPRPGPALARMNYIGLEYERCSDCHESPHAEGVSTQDCTSCHATGAWGGADLHFDHDTQAGFSLDATHQAVACGACHQTQVYRPLESDCASCHADVDAALGGDVMVAGALESWAPSPHAGLLSCRDCHDTGAPSQDTSDYAQACARCHTPLHAQLFLDRDAHLRGLLIEGRRLATTDAQRARLDAAERVGGHAYPAAERQASLVLEELRR